MSQTTYDNGNTETVYTTDTVFRSSSTGRRGFADIIGSITQNAADLASAEVRLARDEAIDTGKETLTGGILTLLAGVLAIPVLIFLGLALSAALLGLIGAIGANLVTAAIFAVIAFILYSLGRNKIGGQGETFGQTKKNLRRDQATVKENLH